MSLSPSETTQKISAFVITYNRAEVFEACLRSVRFADELIVIDKGSTDGSIEMATRYADRVISLPWSPNVEETRAYALSQCSHNFIVFLDDDESFTTQCIAYLRDQAQRHDADIYAIPLRHYILGRHDERSYYWPERQVRAFWRGSVTFSSTVHSSAIFLSESIVQLDTDSSTYINHLSHTSAKVWFEKANRYTSITDRHTSFNLNDLRPLKKFAHDRVDHWLSAGWIEGDDYVDTVGLMRAMYDLMDAVKLVELSLVVRPDADFPRIAAELCATYDRFSVETGIRTQGQPGDREPALDRLPERIDADTQWRKVVRDTEQRISQERATVASLRADLVKAESEIVDRGRVIQDRDAQAATRDARLAELEQMRNQSERKIILLSGQVGALAEEQDARSRELDASKTSLREAERRLRLLALQGNPQTVAAPAPMPIPAVPAAQAAIGLSRPLDPPRIARQQIPPLTRNTSSLRDELAASGLFDADFYRTTYTDVTEAGVDPFEHYLSNGMAEGRQPSAGFDPAFYARRYPGAVSELLVLHYIRHGRAEGRLGAHGLGADFKDLRDEIAGSGLFDADFYRLLYGRGLAGADDPLDDFIIGGMADGRLPSAKFDPTLYAKTHPDIGGPGDAFLHYLRFGQAEGRKLSPLGFESHALPALIANIRERQVFDEAYYRTMNPVVKAEGLDPILHYLLWGFRGKADISPDMPMHAYLAANPHIRQSGANPLLHWLQQGHAEGRKKPGSLKDAIWIDAGCSDLLPDNSVSFELLRGEAYFTGHRFSFDPADSGGLVAEAVAGLAGRRPQLTINMDAPDVSIIIPVYGQVPFLLGCLDALAAHQSRYSVEILVADDASPASMRVQDLAPIPWIRLERRKRNSGFVDCCNFGAGQARGRTLVFLNSDTRVVDGWLDELIGSFDLFPKAGLVGSKLFNDDGTLQEAGGLFWRDGSAWNYGRGDNPNRPKYCFARQADYISGASIAVPAAVWREMDGFDVAFRPAYCEDADLAFRLRRAGYETWYQPLSRVIHYEGKTHGRDLTTSLKAYQTLNLQLMKQRYAKEMSRFAENGMRPKQEANRKAGTPMLVLDAGTHTPDRDAGSLVASRMMQVYRELGFSQVFMPMHDIRWKPVYTEALQRIGVECHYLPFTGTIETILAEDSNFALVLAYRYMIVSQVYDILRERLPAARILFSNVDLHYLREQREAALKNNKQAEFTAAVTKMRELEVFAQVDCSLVHTPVERVAVQSAMPTPLETILEFPWIADTRPSAMGREERRDIMFLGGFGHPPNVDAVAYFVAEVWPRLHKDLPGNARFIIAGDAAPEEIRGLATDRIIVTGYIPDLGPCFDSARVFVAPLRFGAGIKGKLIDALSYGVPCVGTSIAVEGIGLETGRHIIVADEAEAFAQGVVRLYQEAALWHAMQAEGYRFVTDNFSWQRATSLCQEALDIASKTWQRRHQSALRRRLETIMADQ